LWGFKNPDTVIDIVAIISLVLELDVYSPVDSGFLKMVFVSRKFSGSSCRQNSQGKLHGDGWDFLWPVIKILFSKMIFEQE
jgi:hypothetical protein